MAEGGVTLKVGHSWSKSFGDTPFESKPTITVDKPDIASVSWSGGESGTLTITGNEEGDCVVTIAGKVRVVELGTGGGAITVKDVSATVPVKVTGTDEYSKLAVLHVKQKMSVTFPKGMKLGSKGIRNTNPEIVFVKRNSSKQLTLKGKKKGESWLYFKLLVEEDGKEKEVHGTIWVQVKAGKPPKNERHIRMGWDDLYIGQIIMLNPPEGMTETGELKTPRTRTRPSRVKKKKSGKVIRTGMLLDWPGTDGVNCTFSPSGRNYGNIGDLIIKNDTDKPASVTVPPGMLLDSSDPAVQDLYVADVPTETPCSGAKEIGKPITIEPGATHVIKDTPGFCPDFEKKPPTKGDATVYACKQPDEKSKVLLDTIACANKLDVGSLKLEVFEEDKAREMVTQGSLWMVDSEVDETKGNEVCSDDLSSKFFETFAASAKESLDKMSSDDREEAEKLVKDDIKKIVAATSFIAKQSTPESTTQEDDEQGELPDTVIEISDTPAAATSKPSTCPRKKKPGRIYNNSEARVFDDTETARVNELLDGVPNFLFNMNLVFLRVDKWAFDPENPGGYQGGGMIVLTDKFFSMTKVQQEKALQHELGHQWHENNLELVQDFLKIGWNVEEGKTYKYDDLRTKGALSGGGAPTRKKNGNFPRRSGDTTDPPYSATNPIEDFGVSLELYLNDPASLKAQSPERYDWMENNIPKNAPPSKPAGK
jgi:hypothetical protein